MRLSSHVVGSGSRRPPVGNLILVPVIATEFRSSPKAVRQLQRTSAAEGTVKSQKEFALAGLLICFPAEAVGGQ